MIQFLTSQYMNQAKALWQQAFGDTTQAIDLYFSEGCRPSDILIDAETGRLCAMLSMLPLRFTCGEKSLEGRYIYAVATDKSERGKGRSTRLLEHAHRVMRGQGVAAAILVPASQSLFSFYEKRGYCRAFQLSRRIVRADEIKTNTALPHEFIGCEAKRYYHLRKHAFAPYDPFAEWGPSMLDFAVRLARLYGGRLVHIQAQHGEAAVSYVMRESTVIIKEIAAMGIDIDSVLAILHSHLDAPRYEVSLPPQEASPANDDFAMIHPLAAEALPMHRPYFNLAMD